MGKQINGVAAGQSATVHILFNIGSKCNKIGIQFAITAIDQAYMLRQAAIQQL